MCWQQRLRGRVTMTPWDTVWQTVNSINLHHAVGLCTTRENWVCSMPGCPHPSWSTSITILSHTNSPFCTVLQQQRPSACEGAGPGTPEERPFLYLAINPGGSQNCSPAGASLKVSMAHSLCQSWFPPHCKGLVAASSIMSPGNFTRRVLFCQIALENIKEMLKRSSSDSANYLPPDRWCPFG